MCLRHAGLNRSRQATKVDLRSSACERAGWPHGARLAVVEEAPGISRLPAVLRDGPRSYRSACVLPPPPTRC
jgi:hypothetical protein